MGNRRGNTLQMSFGCQANDFVVVNANQPVNYDNKLSVWILTGRKRPESPRHSHCCDHYCASAQSVSRSAA